MSKPDQALQQVLGAKLKSLDSDMRSYVSGILGDNDMTEEDLIETLVPLLEASLPDETDLRSIVKQLVDGTEKV